MKTKAEICNALDNLAKSATNYSGMTYEEGIRDALDWVIGYIEDKDFEFSSDEQE